MNKKLSLLMSTVMEVSLFSGCGKTTASDKIKVG